MPLRLRHLALLCGLAAVIASCAPTSKSPRARVMTDRDGDPITPSAMSPEPAPASTRQVAGPATPGPADPTPTIAAKPEEPKPEAAAPQASPPPAPAAQTKVDSGRPEWWFSDVRRENSAPRICAEALGADMATARSAAVAAARARMRAELNLTDTAPIPGETIERTWVWPLPNSRVGPNRYAGYVLISAKAH